MLVGLLPLLLLEVGLRLTGIPAADELHDPWIGFSSLQPLFELDPGKSVYRTAPQRQAFFAEAEFPLKKSPDTFRVFCLGGSTVQGRPYQPPTAFSSWLKLSLKAADPDRNWEVINCGGVSYASYRLVPILEEVLAYQPDLVIIYSGHNEFLEHRTYDSIREPGWLGQLGQATASRLHMAALIRRGWLALRQSGNSTPAETLPTEVSARLDREGGLADYHRDDAWQRHVMGHFQLNIRRLIQLAGHAGVPLILVNPVEDLRDSPPFKSEFDGSLSASQLQQCQQLLSDASGEGSQRTMAERMELLEQLLQLDPRRADALYLLGRLAEVDGQASRASELLIRAKDEDICPLRMFESMHEQLIQIARRTGTPLVDARQGFRDKLRSPIVGSPAMIDHVHPSLEGQQWIAAWLLEKMVQMDLVQLSPGWDERRQQLQRQQLASLSDVYFARGQKRLEGLKMWTRGLAGRTDLLIEENRQQHSGDPQ